MKTGKLAFQRPVTEAHTDFMPPWTSVLRPRSMKSIGIGRTISTRGKLLALPRGAPAPPRSAPSGRAVLSTRKRTQKVAARRSTEKKNAGPHRAISPTAPPKSRSVPHHGGRASTHARPEGTNARNAIKGGDPKCCFPRIAAGHFLSGSRGQSAEELGMNRPSRTFWAKAIMPPSLSLIGQFHVGINYQRIKRRLPNAMNRMALPARQVLP
jgi:hypothetical protein